MKLFIVMAATVAFLALMVVGNSPALVSASSLILDSKVEPKDVTLNKNSKATKTPDKNTVPFSHENHAVKNYSADLKSVASCAECHHTDQPKGDLKGVLKTSERDVLLTSKVLQAADAKPVKSCQSCHTREGEKPTGFPDIAKVNYPDEGEVVLTNEEAYHRNCITCHESVKKVKASTTAPTSCANCHSGK